MKKIIYLPFLALLVSTACKKHETQQLDPNYQFYFKRDGVLLNLGRSHSSVGNTTSGDFIFISAQSPSSKIGMSHTGIRKNIAPGTYTYQFGSPEYLLIPFVYYPNSNTSYYADHGTLHVLSNDTIARRIEFKFQFELYDSATHSDTIQVTEGHIIASY